MINKLVVEWMQPKLSTLLGDSIDDSKSFSKLRPNYVQVLSANDTDRFLIVSDGCNSMTVMLTTACIAKLATDENYSVSDLRQSVVRLEKYHFSTCIKNAATRDEEKFAGQKITFPVVIQCSHIKYIGCFGIDILGSPTDLNSDPEVAKHLNSLNYSALEDRLGGRQFPKKGFLPNEGTQSFLSTHSTVDELKNNPKKIRFFFTDT